MGNLGLEDAEEVEDQSIRMPEDILSSSAAQELKTTKRKIDEVVDSEDEDEIEIGTAARLPVVLRGQRGFLPSSQLAQEGAEEGGSPLSARQTAGVEDHAVDGQDDDMLLQN